MGVGVGGEMGGGGGGVGGLKLNAAQSIVDSL